MRSKGSSTSGIRADSSKREHGVWHGSAIGLGWGGGGVDLMPHGSCLRWTPGLLGLHAGSDLLISFAYKVIPLALGYVAARRTHRHKEDMRFFWLFVAFILLCGFTHDLDVVVLWYPYYWLQGGVKLATGIVSFAVAVTLVMAIPALTGLPSYAGLAERNRRLQDLVDELQTRALAMRGNPAVRAEIDAMRARLVALRGEPTGKGDG